MPSRQIPAGAGEAECLPLLAEADNSTQHMKTKPGQFLKVLSDAVKLFVSNDPLRMAGATAFFTMFALPPILILLVQVFSLFLDPQAVRHEVFISLSGTLGEEAVRQIISVIRAFRKLTYNWAATIIGFIFLTFVATTLLKVIKDSINQIWGFHLAKHRKVLSKLRSRGKSLLVIFSTGLIFSIAVFIEALQAFIGNYFFRIFPSFSPFFNRLQAFVVSTLIIATWFFIIFRYLAHGRPSFRVAWTGALFTGLLFSIGKIILHFLLSYSNVNTIYGASASVVLLLLFLFYSSMILYYGAAFTKTWAVYKGKDIVDIPQPLVAKES
jgi:membrane protein